MHTHFLDLQNIFIYPLTCLNRESRFVPLRREKIPPIYQIEGEKLV